MKKFSKFDTAQIKTGSIYDPLPKGAYVIKIIKAQEEPNKNSNGSHVKVGFDIAEGEYKDFYRKQFDASANEDKHWPYDGIYNLSIPDDNSEQWLIDNFGTFVAALEDSNKGYHWDWDETKWKGLIVGALFRNEPSASGENVYDHTRPCWFRSAQSIRDGKYGRLPKDKPLKGKVEKSPDAFMTPPTDVDEDIPFL